MSVYCTKCWYIFNRIFYESTKFEGHTDMTEPWYGTAHSVEKVTSSMIQVCLLVIYYIIRLPFFLLVVQILELVEFTEELINRPFLLQQWMERAPNEHLHLPAPNVFIPTDLSLKDVLEKVFMLTPYLFRFSIFNSLMFKNFGIGRISYTFEEIIIFKVVVQAWCSLSDSKGIC